MMNQATPSKQDLFANLLVSAQSVFIHINTNIMPERIRLPAHLYRRDQVVLQFGLSLPVPITDLQHDEISLGATLSFGGHKTFCVIPWRNVWAIMNDHHQGFVWEHEVPHSIRQEAAQQSMKSGPLVISSPTQSASLTKTTSKVQRALPSGWAVIPGGK